MLFPKIQNFQDTGVLTTRFPVITLLPTKHFMRTRNPGRTVSLIIGRTTGLNYQKARPDGSEAHSFSGLNVVSTT